MSAVTAPLEDQRPPLALLARVELRKLADTRAGRWLLAIVALLIVAVTVLYALTGPDDEQTYLDFFQVLQLPTGVLLPVLGILLVTSEWSQRTALTTFTLVPDRTRIVAAKALAVTAVTFAAIIVTLAGAAVGTVLAGADGSWTFGGAELGEIVVMQLAGFLGGLAFGLAFQASAPAIVFYFILPTLISILTAIASAIEDVMKWVDMGQATLPFGEGHVSGLEWGRFGTSVAVWIAVPLAVGLWRLWHSEVK